METGITIINKELQFLWNQINDLIESDIEPSYGMTADEISDIRDKLEYLINHTGTISVVSLESGGAAQYLVISED